MPKSGTGRPTRGCSASRPTSRWAKGTLPNPDILLLTLSACYGQTVYGWRMVCKPCCSHSELHNPSYSAAA